MGKLKIRNNDKSKKTNNAKKHNRLDKGKRLHKDSIYSGKFIDKYQQIKRTILARIYRRKSVRGS
jgi:hypothetical protein